jgi:hypothetical protein
VNQELIDFTQYSQEKLKELGCIRWGRQPIPNLWLLPGPLFLKAAKGQTLHGIDGKTYVVGFNYIDSTLLFGYLAYGVKVDSDTAPGGPEIPPEKLVQLAEKLNSQGKERRALLKAMGDRGMFFAD